MKPIGRSWACFAVIEPDTRTVVFEGTTAECGEFFGVSAHTFYIGSQSGRYKGYDIVRLDVAHDFTKEDYEAMAKWDAFVEPLRKKYGIPIRPLEQKRDKR